MKAPKLVADRDREWYVANREPRRAKGRGPWEIAANGTHLADAQSEEIADQIVRAVNAHAALVDALRGLLNEIDDASYGHGYIRAVKPQDAIDKARAALALADD
jgi:hypothetical protein